MFNNPTSYTEFEITELEAGGWGGAPELLVDGSVNVDQEVQVQVEIDTHEDRATVIEIETTVDVVEQVTSTATRNAE